MKCHGTFNSTNPNAHHAGGQNTLAAEDKIDGHDVRHGPTALFPWFGKKHLKTVWEGT